MYENLIQEMPAKKTSNVKKYSAAGTLIGTILICMFLLSQNIIDGNQPGPMPFRNSKSAISPSFDPTFVLKNYTITPELEVSKQLKCYRLNKMRCSPSEMMLYDTNNTLLCGVEFLCKHV